VKSNARLIFATVIFCFLASGAAGLVYQVAWARYLALFLGHTSYAIVAVLVAFMGGLALGNFWFGGIADRSRKPLAIYAWLEFAIGLYGILFPAYYAFCHDAYIALARTLGAESTALLGLKFMFSFLTILLPTVLMGATFPVLVRFVTRSLSELRERVAALYAINSAGAVAGVLIADFWWIPSVGLEATVYGAAGLNLMAGLVSFVLSLRIEDGTIRQEPSAPVVKRVEENYTEGELRLAIVAIGISGFVAMLYEVAWSRLLALALGSSTHAFSLMLITFITGIAVGAWIVYMWKSLRRTLVAFGWAELALAFTLLVSMFFYQYLSFWFVKLAGLLARREEAYPLYEFLQALICFGVMFVPAVCLGMTLPLISRVATVELSRTGRSVGKVFAVNTLGTVLGAVVTGLWLMPWLGLAQTFAVGIALNAMIGLAALTWSQVSRRWVAVVAPLVAGVGVFWFAGAMLDPIWQRAFSLGLWRMPELPPNAAVFRQMIRDVPLIYHKDGAGSTVTVYSWEEGGRNQVSLKVNGKADAGTQSDLVTQLLIGHLPMLLRPESKDVLVIGLGSGMTTSAVARHPGVERLEAVEISPTVVEAAKFFSEYNDRILENPKLRLAVEDAKSYLKLSDRDYDVIISQPSNPWMAGVAAVFSQEYYEDCRARLRPDGLMIQWMQIYETTDRTVELVLRTFSSVFPYMSVWQPAMGDFILVGSTQPMMVNIDAMERRYADPLVHTDLARAGLFSFTTILAREIISEQNGLFVVPPDGPVHSDYFPELEYLAQKGLFLNRMASGWRHFREDFSPRATTLFGQFLRQYPLSEGDFLAFSRDYLRHGVPEPSLFRSILHRWQGNSPTPAFPLELWARGTDTTPAAELRALQLAPMREAMFEAAPTNPEPLRLHASDLMESYRSRRSIFHLPPTADLEAILERLIETDPQHQRVYRMHLAEMAWDRGDDGLCLQLGERAFDPDVTKAGPVDFSRDRQAPLAVLYRMIESLWRAGQIEQAWHLAEQARIGGHLAGADTVFPLLHVTYRKVQASFMAQLEETRQNPPPSSGTPLPSSNGAAR
jgi:spermidine synthase